MKPQCGARKGGSPHWAAGVTMGHNQIIRPPGEFGSRPAGKRRAPNKNKEAYHADSSTEAVR